MSTHTGCHIWLIYMISNYFEWGNIPYNLFLQNNYIFIKLFMIPYILWLSSMTFKLPTTKRYRLTKIDSTRHWLQIKYDKEKNKRYTWPKNMHNMFKSSVFMKLMLKMTYYVLLNLVRYMMMPWGKHHNHIPYVCHNILQKWPNWGKCKLIFA